MKGMVAIPDTQLTNAADTRRGRKAERQAGERDGRKQAVACARAFGENAPASPIERASVRDRWKFLAVMGRSLCVPVRLRRSNVRPNSSIYFVRQSTPCQ
jgi:hypothetical protein